MNDITENDDEIKTVRLTQREVTLLLKYGYPFEEVEARLRACKDRKGTHTIKIGEFNIEHLIGDLVYSAKNIVAEDVLLTTRSIVLLRS